MSWQRGDKDGFARGLRGRRQGGLGRRDGRRLVRADGRGLRVSFFVFVALACGLLAGGVFYPSVASDARTKVESFIAPGLSAGATLLAPVRALGRTLFQVTTTSGELGRLRQENQELRAWKWRAGEAERKLRDLRALAKVVRKPGVGFVTARVLSLSLGLRQHSIMIDAGTDHGLLTGDAVISGDGLVGVIAEATRRTARVRLLDDPLIKIDVVVGRDFLRGRLVGDRDGLARIDIAEKRAVFRAGDKVVTSGSMSGIPRGLRVGMLVSERSGMKVAPYAGLARLEYVSVLLRPKDSRPRLVEGVPFTGPVRASNPRAGVSAGDGHGAVDGDRGQRRF